MKLKNLDKFEEIVIQMHNNPDADSIGTGYAIYKYLQEKGKKVRLIYGGKRKITKSNILIMIDELNIPVEHVESLEEKPELLLTVDCQYGEGNVQRFEAENIAMIDHHNTGKKSDDMCEIRSHLVSCATIAYDMLREQGFDVNKDISVSTALYYGMYMDSNGFSEIRHPIERDMIDFLIYDKLLLNKMCHANFSREELETAGIAMLRYNYDEKRRFAIINSKPCDPNILGVIGDIILQVDAIDVSIIYNDCQDGYKLSVRSCAVEVAANDLAIYLTTGIGNGGGHIDKAGGYINKNQFQKKYGDLGIDTYFFDKATQYYDSFKVIRYEDGLGDITGFKKYQKKDHTYGFVKSTDIFPVGTECKIRSLEGDVFITASEDIYIMIGIRGNVYPIERVTFEEKYTEGSAPYEMNFEYIPTVINIMENTFHNIMPYARECYCYDKAVLFAKKLNWKAKVFSKWDYETYMLGDLGDYLCYPENDVEDIYITKQDIFGEIYEEIQE